MWKRSSSSHRQLPAIPRGARIYAVGDIHGRADLLALLLSQIELDTVLYPAVRPIAIFLGDYIDRGPTSKDVLDLLTTRSGAWESVFLKGNHEDFLLKFLADPAVLDDWRCCGGLETLVSYGLKPSFNPNPSEQAQLSRDLARILPVTHRRFLAALEPSFVCGDYLFVHAGVRPLVPLRQQKEDDLLWIRDEFLLWEEKFEKVVVHGHTPVQAPDIRTNRINIDTGAFATGRLTCMVFEGCEIRPLADVRVWASRLTGCDEADVLTSERAVESLCQRVVTSVVDRISGDAAGSIERDFLTRADPRWRM